MKAPGREAFRPRGAVAAVALFVDPAARGNFSGWFGNDSVSTFAYVVFKTCERSMVDWLAHSRTRRDPDASSSDDEH